MTILLRLAEAAREAAPYKTAIVSRDLLIEAQARIQEHVARAERAQTVAFIGWMVALGLAVGLAYSRAHPRTIEVPQQPSELTSDPEPMRLRPGEILTQPPRYEV